MKSAAGSATEDLLKSLDATEDYLADAPPEVQAAHMVLKQHVELSADGGDDEGVRAKLADRLRSYLTKSNGKDEIDVDRNELVALLAEREDRILKAVDDRLAESEELFKSAGDPNDEDEVASLTENLDVTRDALDAALDRLAAVEKSLTTSSQVDGQEQRYIDTSVTNEKGEKVEKSALRIAFERAANGERVTLGRGD